MLLVPVARMAQVPWLWIIAHERIHEFFSTRVLQHPSTQAQDVRREWTGSASSNIGQRHDSHLATQPCSLFTRKLKHVLRCASPIDESGHHRSRTSAFQPPSCEQEDCIGHWAIGRISYIPLSALRLLETYTEGRCLLPFQSRMLFTATSVQLHRVQGHTCSMHLRIFIASRRFPSKFPPSQET